MTAYPRLFSEWQIGKTTIKNRVVFPPTCPSWVSDPWNGLFTDMATAYYAERAKGGVGLIIIGATHVHPSSIMAPLLMPQLFDDRQIEPLSKIADAATSTAASSRSSSGTRASAASPRSSRSRPTTSTRRGTPSRPARSRWASSLPGRSRRSWTRKRSRRSSPPTAQRAARAEAAGLDGVEFHLSHGYLPWQFLSPLYNKRTDRWGGSYENRLRFPVEALKRMREAVGEDVFVGYRINSTSFWPGDLELEDVKQIVQDLEQQADVDYVNVSAGVHHAFIHTPMEFEAGWERGYARGDQGRLVEARAAGRTDHDARRGRDAARERGRGRDLPGATALRRRRVGAARRRKGARRTSGGASRRTTAGRASVAAPASSASTTRRSGGKRPGGAGR